MVRVHASSLIINWSCLVLLWHLDTLPLRFSGRINTHVSVCSVFTAEFCFCIKKCKLNEKLVSESLAQSISVSEILYIKLFWLRICNRSQALVEKTGIGELNDSQFFFPSRRLSSLLQYFRFVLPQHFVASVSRSTGKQMRCEICMCF